MSIYAFIRQPFKLPYILTMSYNLVYVVGPNLNDPCGSDSDCSDPYAICDGGLWRTCTCRGDYLAYDGACGMYVVYMWYICGMYVVYMWYISLCGIYVVCMWCICGIYVVCMWYDFRMYLTLH